jgi:hypothetical protein
MCTQKVFIIFLVPSGKLFFMNELIQQIVEKTGIPADKAQQVLGVVSGFVKQKFPAFGSQIDSVLGSGNSADDSAGSSSSLGNIGSKLGF